MGKSYLIAIFGLILVLIGPKVAQIFPIGAHLIGLAYFCVTAILAKPAQAINRVHQLTIGALTGLGILAIITSTAYYLTSINIVTLSCAAIFTLGACLAIATKNKHLPHTVITENQTWQSVLATLIAAAPLIASLSAMHAHPVLDAVRTPWTPENTLSILAPVALSAFLTISLHAKKILTQSSTLLLIGLTAFTITSFAALTYPLGYGFDPHIHHATLEHIAQHGTITPKPPYYVAMYGLELTAHVLFGFTFNAIDPFLAPALFALTLILAAGSLTRHNISGLAVLITLPLAAFIQTTPYAVSLTLLLATIVSTSSKDHLRSWLFACAALLAHPIAGLPALLTTLIVTIGAKIPKKYNDLGLLSAFIFGVITLPSAFLIDAHLAHRTLEITIPTIITLANTLTPAITLLKQGNATLDAIYSFAGVMTLFTGALALYGYTHSSKEDQLFGALSLGTSISAIIITTIFNFTYLISYEQSDFALRAVVIANLLALPLLLKGLEKIYEKITLQSFAFQIGAATVVALTLAASTYLTYPRHDAYATSSGFNVSQADLEAVQIIEKYAGEHSYAVLGNQAISAAALHTFGFTDRYLESDTYFYPIPTSGQLYADFLSFTQGDQSPEVIEQIFDRTKAELIIVVIHDYWWDAKNITQNATAISDDVLELPDGLQGFIFKKNAP